MAYGAPVAVAAQQGAHRVPSGRAWLVVGVAIVWTLCSEARLVVAIRAAGAIRHFAQGHGSREFWSSGPHSHWLTTYHDGVEEMFWIRLLAWVSTGLWLSASRSLSDAVNPTYPHRLMPRHSWLSWIVPFGNFALPFMYVGDVYRATAGSSPKWLRWWWGSWLVFWLTEFAVSPTVLTPGWGTDSGLRAEATRLVATNAIAGFAGVIALIGWTATVRGLTATQRTSTTPWPTTPNDEQRRVG